MIAAVSILPSGHSISAAESAVAFAFQGADYFHRWSQKEQHEFTPAKQEDLEKWTDMIAAGAV